MKKSIVFLIVLLQLNSCSAVKVKDSREAKLMPEKVAKEVLGKYLDFGWVANPTGMAIHQNVCPGSYPMPYNTIKHVTEFHGTIRSGGIIWIENWDWPYWNAYPCGSKSRMIIKRDTAFSVDELSDITDALVSLGAQIKEVEHK